jgi:nicotinate dehydrogenase subunit A
VPELIGVKVNGWTHALPAAGAPSLLDVLRNRLGLMATRFGCGEGLCGASRVLVDGRALAACDTPLSAVAGCSITTAEGLGTPQNPHPVQTALIAEQAMQCGYCISGIMISAVALLEKTRDPSEAEIRVALDRNLCRCGARARTAGRPLQARLPRRQGQG